ncbi:carboxypeptidase regulatory-like domain-containing protein [Solitalea canadensis]|uniref:Outer membrane receptor protein n=1 Tax=Solitalea canadensis (strain ATCC 29591 / DSM 3403 / JCM 21819 / LMG 8368 / NBRC 15130 / NCIMB 12057 / USAM 9D) TaxID=929556 RepID=H8KUB4_SOLCM|nr:carboxypeptidase regulatory-like domain-containing protein [Solitalea canadensis]AFD07226.1 outer membrane receptor protein [Solitalea canadensis DSM 3403]
MNFYQCMRVMKFTMLLLTCLFVQVHANSYAQRITMSKQNASIHTVLEEIRKQSQYDFFYDTDLFNHAKPASIEVKNATVEQVLNACFAGKPYSYTIDNKVVVITEAEVNSTAKSQVTEVTGIVRQQSGRISGKVMDDKGEPLIGANVKIVQTGQVLQSSTDGSYSFNVLPGTYTIEVSYVSFKSKRITDVVVKAGALTTLNVVLNAVVSQLDQVVVTASYKTESTNALYTRQKNKAGISNGISSEQIAALPDKNIGETLKRISGVSTTDNRRVVVRGIAERYNMAMMDGAALPSTDVQVRDFEFDIIPSNLVDNVVVSKTATPDMGFGFGGGMVQINTMAIPDNNFTTFSLGSKYINGSTGKDFLGYARGSNDYLGFDDGNRAHFPKDLFSFTNQNYRPTDPYNTSPPEGVEKITPEMISAQNKRIGGLERLGSRMYTTAPGQNYQFSLGRNYNLKTSRFGFVGSLSYRNEQAIDDILHFERGSFNMIGSNLYSPETGEEINESKASQYNFTTSWGALLNAGWNSKNHHITFRNFYSRVFANQFFRISGWGEDEGFEENPVIKEYDRPKYIDLLQNRINGEHNFGYFKFDWSVARNKVTNQELDAVDAEMDPIETINGTVYNYVPGGTTNPGVGTVNRSKYEYQEINWIGDAALSYKFNIRKMNQVVKAGYQYMAKKGDYSWNVLPIGVANLANYNVKYVPIQNWNLDFADPLHDVYYFPAAVNSNNYTGRNNNQAWYIMMDNRFTHWLRLVWGIRGEYYKYEKIKDAAADLAALTDMNNLDKKRYVDPETGNLVHQSLDAGAEDKQWQYLPSANLTITPLENFNIRASYAKSAIRPALIENSSFARFNYLYGRIQRNTGVVSTLITHYDLRMEWYPSPGEVISAGYFKKHFRNPVEMYLDVTNTSGAVDLLTANSDYADVKGWELDIRKKLDFIYPGWKPLKNLYLSSNLTLQHSEVQASAFRYETMGAGEDNDGVSYAYRKKTYLKEKRPLYGQVPVLYNVGLQYDGDRLGANIAYNHSGYKTFTVAMQPQYSEIERPRDQLDAQLSYKFLKDKKLQVKLNISNLLNSPYRFFINGQNTYKTKPGADIMNMNEWSDVYEWKYGFSDKYEEGYYEPMTGNLNRRIGDTDTFIRKAGTSFSLALSYSF